MDKSHRTINLIIWLAIIMVTVFVIAIFLDSRVDKPSPAELQQEQDQIMESVLKSAPRKGPANGRLIMAEFGDFQCPFCREVAPIIKQILEKYPNELQIVWIFTLNPQHPQSEPAAIAGHCANQQNKFWEFHDKLFEHQPELGALLYSQIAQSLDLDMAAFNNCLADPDAKAVVRNHNKFAKLSEIKGTPHTQLNDSSLTGAFSFEELDQMIQYEK